MHTYLKECMILFFLKSLEIEQSGWKKDETNHRVSIILLYCGFSILCNELNQSSKHTFFLTGPIR